MDKPTRKPRRRTRAARTEDVAATTENAASRTLPRRRGAAPRLKKRAASAPAEKTEIATKPARSARGSRHVPARKTQSKDQEFMALLRRQCMRAATIGALTAAAEAVPGLGRLLRLISGELLDAALLAAVQRELVEKTFELYEVRLPAVIRTPLIERVQVLGSGAALSGDAFLRRLLKQGLGKIGGLLVSRAVPLLPIVTSASTNAAITYAIGKRAQAVAKLRDASLADVGEVVRAFTGVDERRIYAWSTAAVKDALGATGKLFGRIAALPSRVIKGARAKKSADEA